MSTVTTSRPKRKAAFNKTYTYEDPNLLERRRSLSKLTAMALAPALTLSSLSTNLSPKKRSARSSLPPRVPLNWQPPSKPLDHFSNRLNLEGAYLDHENQKLICPNHHEQMDVLRWCSTTVNNKRNQEIPFGLSKGDYIYMVSEPPGEPYYIGRIMSFTTSNRANGKAANGTTSGNDLKQYMLQMQWLYRPRDIAKSTSELRLLFALMHTDTCPLTLYRGRVVVKHKAEVDDLDEFSAHASHFYFDKLFDRYMIKFYDVLVTADLVTVGHQPNLRLTNYVDALHKRFEYVFVEPLRTKPLMEVLLLGLCNCDGCGGWCDLAQDLISCVECLKYFHMYCLDPPLLKKPSRGFSWSCARCAKKQQLEYHSKRLLMLSADNKLSNEVDIISELTALNQPVVRDLATPLEEIPGYESKAIEFLAADADNLLEQRRIKEEWCMRYLGMHAKLEEGVDVDDRNPYPRALTRLGARHQAALIPECDGHPVVYYDKAAAAKSAKRGRKKLKQPVEEVTPLPVPKKYQDTPVKEYPPWLQPRPTGYIERGVDDGKGDTCTLLWKLREEDIAEDFTGVDAYIDQCAPIAEALGILANSPNFMDYITKAYMDNHGSTVKAFKKVKQLLLATLKEPVFTKDEIRKFEAGVKKYGSELYPVFKMVKTQPCSMVVRYYYLWKKTESGRKIWGNFEGRRHKKLQNQVVEEKAAEQRPPVDELADGDDDLSYDQEKVNATARAMVCKHCQAVDLTKWFRISSGDVSKKKNEPVVGLCRRCARLWRRYGVVWEDPEEVERRQLKVGRRKIELELVVDLTAILLEMDGESLENDLLLLAEATNPLPPPSKRSRREDKKNDAKEVVVKEEGKKEEVKQEKEKGDKQRHTKNSLRISTDTETNIDPAEDAPLPVVEKVEVKKKRPTKVKTEPVEKRRKVETPAPTADSVKEEFLVSPMYQLPKLAPPATSLSQLVAPESTEESTSQFLAQFKQRVKIDQATLLSQLMLPENMQVAIPHSASTTCSVCHHGSASEKDMLVCLLCRVGIHSLCGGFLIPDKTPRPVYEWLCDECTNELKPLHLARSSCCLCYDNESPTYLKPVFDLGKWVHPQCLLYLGNLVALRPPPVSFSTKRKPTRAEFRKATVANDSIVPAVVVELVAAVLVEHRDHQCVLCNRTSGLLIQCEGCPQWVHPGCAMIDKRYSLGFALDASDSEIGAVRIDMEENATDSTSASTTTTNDHPQGIPRPAVACLDHGTPTAIYSGRQLARRCTNLSTARPLIHWYWEDLAKTVIKGISGAQARLAIYIENYLRFTSKHRGFDPEVGTNRKCHKCNTPSSPYWFGNHCLYCHQRGDETPESDTETGNLADVLRQPLDGSKYGIENNHDRLQSPELA